MHRQSACMPDKDKVTARRLGWLARRPLYGEARRGTHATAPAEVHQRTGWHGAARRPWDWTHAAGWGKEGPPGVTREERGSGRCASVAKYQSHRSGISPALGLHAREDVFI